MRWIAFFILAYLTVAVQSGAAHFLERRGAWPNLPLLIAVFAAMCAPRNSAVLGAMLVGFLQDLVTSRPFGLFALSYGLAAMMIVPTQAVADRTHPLTHALLTFIAAAVTALLIFIAGLRWPDQREPAYALLGTTLYTTLCGLPVLGVLTRMKRTFGLRDHARSTSSLRSMAGRPF